jgi:hypothetical protein
MEDKQIIPHRMNLNQILVDNSLAIVLVEDPLPLVAIPPKALAPAKPRSYERAYFAQVHAPTLPSPPKRLLLKDAPPKGPIIKVPADTKLLPLKDNEVLTRVKMDKLGQIICAKYFSRPTIEGIRAHPSKDKFLPPKEAPQKALPQERRKRQRTTVASLEEQVKFLAELVKSLDKDHKLVSRSMTTTNERIDLERIEHKELEAKVESLASDVRGDGKEKK